MRFHRHQWRKTGGVGFPPGTKCWVVQCDVCNRRSLAFLGTRKLRRAQPAPGEDFFARPDYPYNAYDFPGWIDGLQEVVGGQPPVETTLVDDPKTSTLTGNGEPQ